MEPDNKQQQRVTRRQFLIAGNVHVLTADNAIEGYWTTPFLIEQFLAELEK